MYVPVLDRLLQTLTHQWLVGAGRVQLHKEIKYFYDLIMCNYSLSEVGEDTSVGESPYGIK